MPEFCNQQMSFSISTDQTTNGFHHGENASDATLIEVMHFNPGFDQVAADVGLQAGEDWHQSGCTARILSGRAVEKPLILGFSLRACGGKR